MRTLAATFAHGQTLPPDLESLVLTAALDVDMNVREIALGLLCDRNHPALAALATAQLDDPDPHVRLLGLNGLKRVKATTSIRRVISLLDEDDPLIVATALKLLETWSGETFGVKLRDTTPIENPTTGLKEFSKASRETAKDGATRAKAWWKAHQPEFPPTLAEIPSTVVKALKPLRTEDFSLRDLTGRRLGLKELRGKVVLLNFWTSWCSACLSEMPELTALQSRHPDRLAIIGVSLDFVPDSHGHMGGHPPVGAEEHSGEGAHERESTSLKNVRQRVARVVKARGLNYTILLDENNELGGRFNGGELPTTVIVDASGNVRRRFVGARSLKVLEAMLAEAGLQVSLDSDRSTQSK